jgi:site-specific recombinase XerD
MLGYKTCTCHTLRHSCGYHLADKGTDRRTMQNYLGHRDLRHTVHYSRITGRRFGGDAGCLGSGTDAILA